MRVSENMKTMNMVYDLNRSLEGLLQKQVDLATSKRIHKPSDDPAGTSKVLKLKSGLRKNEGYEKNVQDGLNWVNATEAALSGVSELLNQVSSILMQGASDTVGEDEREVLSQKMQGLWENAVQLANRQFGDKHLFGGTQNDTRPYALSDSVSDERFTADAADPVFLDNVRLTEGSVQVTNVDGSVAYAEGVDYTVDYGDGSITLVESGAMTGGTEYAVSYRTDDPSTAVLNPDGVDGRIVREIEEGVILDINLTAGEVFEGESGVLAVIKEAVLALERNDREAISDIRRGADACLQRIIQFQGQLGIKTQTLDQQIEHLETERLNLQEVISSVQDTDATSTLLQLQQDQVVYQTALQTGAKLMQLSLLDFL